MAALKFPIDLTEDFQDERWAVIEHNWGEECDCESPHHSPMPPCSERVTHRVILCAGQFSVCDVAATSMAKDIAVADLAPCPFCRVPISSDWRVIPV